MNTQHTPTPWRTEVTQTAVWVGTPKGETKLNDIIFHTDILGLKHEYVEQKLANAAFIVRACNNHEALIEALERILAASTNGLNPGGSVYTALNLAKSAAQSALANLK